MDFIDKNLKFFHTTENSNDLLLVFTKKTQNETHIHIHSVGKKLKKNIDFIIRKGEKKTR